MPLRLTFTVKSSKSSTSGCLCLTLPIRSYLYRLKMPSLCPQNWPRSPERRQKIHCVVSQKPTNPSAMDRASSSGPSSILAIGSRTLIRLRLISLNRRLFGFTWGRSRPRRRHNTPQISPKISTIQVRISWTVSSLLLRRLPYRLNVDRSQLLTLPASISTP